jgi:hypothetical protein
MFKKQPPTIKNYPLMTMVLSIEIMDAEKLGQQRQTSIFFYTKINSCFILKLKLSKSTLLV